MKLFPFVYLNKKYYERGVLACSLVSPITKRGEKTGQELK